MINCGQTPRWIRGGRVLDPAQELDAEHDVELLDGRIVALHPKGSAPADDTAIDASGLWVTPGLIDIHVHFREPGQEYKEDLLTGSRAAVAGGFTSVVCMPNTDPAVDRREVVSLLRRRSQEIGLCDVHVCGAISRGLGGERLADLGEMAAAGAVAFSDDGMPVMDSGLLRRALEYATDLERPLMLHEEDFGLTGGGCMHEGRISTRAGLLGMPISGESGMIARDLEILEEFGGRLHICHLSTAEGLRLVRDARARGLNVTCEVTPHHLFLTDDAVLQSGYHSHTKMSPPLRPQRHVDALRQGLADGSVHAIATDHAPHSDTEKDHDFSCSAFGVTGLEISLALTLKLVEEGVIDRLRAIELLTSGPAEVVRWSDRGSLKQGMRADLCLIDPSEEWVVDPAYGWSRSVNTPFVGWSLTGRPVATVYEGRVVYANRKPAA
ncbi:MAG: dihydroorotase [Myxococcota bacterium]|nr:dihydroorotase [Myxococcota bacterium]